MSGGTEDSDRPLKKTRSLQISKTTKVSFRKGYFNYSSGAIATHRCTSYSVPSLLTLLR